MIIDMKDVKLTDAQRRCILAIHEAGSTVLASHGRLLAAGEFLPFEPITVLRLVGLGMIEFCEPARLRLTLQGLKIAEEIWSRKPAEK